MALFFLLRKREWSLSCVLTLLFLNRIIGPEIARVIDRLNLIDSQCSHRPYFLLLFSALLMVSQFSTVVWAYKIKVF